jgi:predicted regulator of Ras-like GTPase activity (Roadblock/LC7/MglB family)
MLSILLGAAETATSGLNGKFENVFIELDRSRIIIDSAGNKGVLVVVTNTKDNHDSLHAQVKKAVRDLAVVL